MQEPWNLVLQLYDELLSHFHHEHSSLLGPQVSPCELHWLSVQTMSFPEGKEAKFKCSDCDYKTNKKSHLMQHRSRHTKQTKHICSKCNKCFTAASSLRRHLLLHEGEKCHSASSRKMLPTGSLQWNNSSNEMSLKVFQTCWQVSRITSVLCVVKASLTSMDCDLTLLCTQVGQNWFDSDRQSTCLKKQQPYLT